MLVDAGNGEAVEHIEGTHPLGVTLGEVVIDGDDMDAVAGEGIEEDGEGGHEGLTLTGGHLGYLTLMEDYAAKELDIIVYHIPDGLVAAGYPVVVIDGLVAVDIDEVMGGGKLAVEVGGGDDDVFILGEAAGGALHDGEGIGQDDVELLLHAVEHLLLKLVDMVEVALALLDGESLDLFLGGLDLGLDIVGAVLHLMLEGLGTGAEVIVGEEVYLLIGLLDLLNVGLDFAHVARGFVAKYLG